jgi:hypothetical protein
MPGFDEAWAAVAVSRAAEPVSLGLRPLLQAVYFQALSDPLTEVEFKKRQGWEKGWGERQLPEDLDALLASMDEALHDTVRNPEVARNFGCLPEQLLERVQRLPVG